MCSNGRKVPESDLCVLLLPPTPTPGDQPPKVAVSTCAPSRPAPASLSLFQQPEVIGRVRSRPWGHSVAWCLQLRSVVLRLWPPSPPPPRPAIPLLNPSSLLRPQPYPFHFVAYSIMSAFLFLHLHTVPLFDSSHYTVVHQRFFLQGKKKVPVQWLCGLRCYQDVRWFWGHCPERRAHTNNPPPQTPPLLFPLSPVSGLPLFPRRKPHDTTTAYKAFLYTTPNSHSEHRPFRHLPPNSARFGYATDGALFISAQLSTDAERKKRVPSRFKRLWFLFVPV